MMPSDRVLFENPGQIGQRGSQGCLLCLGLCEESLQIEGGKKEKRERFKKDVMEEIRRTTCKGLKQQEETSYWSL